MVEPLLNGKRLREQAGAFTRAMKSVGLEMFAGLEGEDKKIPTTVVWQRMTGCSSFAHTFSEYHKGANLALTMIGGSVEEERTFSGMNFLKSKLRNRLDGHLDMCMRFFCQDFLHNAVFPLRQGIQGLEERQEQADGWLGLQGLGCSAYLSRLGA